MILDFCRRLESLTFDKNFQDIPVHLQPAGESDPKPRFLFLYNVCKMLEHDQLCWKVVFPEVKGKKRFNAKPAVAEIAHSIQFGSPYRALSGEEWGDSLGKCRPEPARMELTNSHICFAGGDRLEQCFDMAHL
jgi:hypothetical protein